MSRTITDFYLDTQGIGIVSYIAVVSCTNILQLREKRHDANDWGNCSF